MQKTNKLVLFIGLLAISLSVQAQYQPRFVLDKGHTIYDAISYSLFSYELSSSVGNTHYKTFVEGGGQHPFYARQTVTTAGKPTTVRELTTDELKQLPSVANLGHLQYKMKKDKPIHILKVSSLQVQANGLVVGRQVKGNKLPILDFRLKNIKRIPFAQRNFRKLEKLQKNWYQTRKKWNNNYTFVVRRDSVYFKNNRAYGLRKVVKVRQGKIVEVKAYKVVQNWLGRRRAKKVYEEKAVKLSQDELNNTQTLDQFLKLSLGVFRQKHHTSFYENDQSIGFEINQFIGNGYIKTYVLETVSAG